MSIIKIINGGYDISVNGKTVVSDARTKDDCYSQACGIHTSLKAAGIDAVIQNSAGQEI